jgi:hypothetical protein
MTDKEALIERLATTCHGLDPVDPLRLLVDDVIAALAQPEQEPVAWLVEFENGEQELHFDEQSVGEIHTPLYTTPPQRTWVGLTGEDVVKAYDDYQSGRFSAGFMGATRSIEAKLKQKNGFAEEKNT